jgi:hypothetical protein
MKMLIPCLALLAIASRAFAQTPTAEDLSAGSRTSMESLLKGLPSYAEMIKRRQREDLMPKPDDAPSPRGTLGFSFNKAATGELRLMDSPRFLSESVDVNVARLGTRVTVGAGYADKSVVVRGVTTRHDEQKYGFLKLELGKPAPREPGRRLRLPTGTYTETEVSPRPRVVVEEHSIRDLKP